jgi:flagellar hook-associated protein 2
MSGRISSSTGLISGVNTGSIVDQLIAIDSRRVTLLTNRVTLNQTIQSAYADLRTKLQSLATDVSSLVRPSTFQSASATSSNTNVLGATAKATATPGTYSFTVARTVSTQSAISTGYPSTTAALGISGSITVGLGGGKVTSTTNLADLNGGAGVTRGSFKITDASGATATVSIASAVSLEDVVTAINSAGNVEVKASIGRDGLVLEDTSGGTGALRVSNIGTSTAATQLGIAGTASGGTLTGASINTVGRSTLLSSLNDGLGVRRASSGAGGVAKDDFRVDLGDGTSTTVSLAAATTLGAALDAINKAGSGKFVASVGADGRSLQLRSNATDAGTMGITVTALNGSHAAADLGIEGTADGTLSGTAVRASLGSVLVKNLQGGAGVALGQISLTDRAGNSGSALLVGASSLSDVISAINSAGTGLVASVNSAGTGLEIRDTSGGTGDIVIASSRGAAARQLGIEGTFGPATATVDGGNLHRQYINENTSLSDLNGGRGISAGRFTITSASGTTAVVDATSAATLGDLITAINGASGGPGGLGVTAAISADGNGLVLTDNSGGVGRLAVKDISGTAAANLQIAGTAAPGSNTINGAFSKTISIDAADSLSRIASKLNQAGAGITASILNDGSGATGNRLSISASNSGLAGQFTLDAGTTGLSLSELTSAQNAAVFVGSPTSATPLLATSSSNTVSNVANGLSLSLVAASTTPITVSVTQSPDTAVTALQSFVADLNALNDKISELTKFSTVASQKGILLGDATTRSISEGLYRAINGPVNGAGAVTKFAEVGLKIDRTNQVSFDVDAFRASYDKDPNALQRVFTAYNTIATTATTDAASGNVTTSVVTTAFGTDPQGSSSGTDSANNKFTKIVKLQGFGIAYQIQDAIKHLVDPVDGTIVKKSSTLDKENDQFNGQVTQMNTLLAAKKNRLLTQFANMESVLSGLQTQQNSLNSLSQMLAANSGNKK